ncbi:MAG: glycosyl transferase, partial [Rhodospirillales bacterium]|nr:glycosyl transferase [Rhodospirillales bacterium]
MDIIIPAAFFIASAAFAALGTGILVRFLPVMDVPNERSSHQTPTLRGGGLAVVPVILLAWLAAAGWAEAPFNQTVLWPVAGAAVLAVLSW